MSKVVALICVLIPVVCHGACAPGDATCNAMDEAALVQKDMTLGQKKLQLPSDTDRQTAAQHISEALSLQYLSQADDAKLKMFKQLQDEYKPISEKIFEVTAKYRASTHSEDDFEAWYDGVTEGLEKMVTSISSMGKTASTDASETRELLMAAFDSMEEQETYGDKLTKFFVASQQSQQAAWIGDVLKQQNEAVLSAMDAYQENGFSEKNFGKAYNVVSRATRTISTTLDSWVEINKRNVQEVQDSKLKFTAHTPASVNVALYDLIAMDKALGRTDLAKRYEFGFMAREQEIVAALQSFSSSKRTETDFKAFRPKIEEILQKTVSMIEEPRNADNKVVEEGKAAVVKSFADLSEEGEFAQKLVKFATAWGRHRLATDLLEVAADEKKTLEEALDAYEEKTKDKYSDKEFGTMYSALLKTLVTLKSNFAQWVTMGTGKENELQPEVTQLNAFMKQ